MVEIETKRDAASATWIHSEQVVGERFRTLEILKQGQRVVTWRGVDETTDAHVVIKLVDVAIVGTGVRMRLEHEAQAIREINGPACSGFSYSGEHDGAIYLVRPFCEGVTLQKRLAQRRLDSGEAATIGRCMMTALHEAHSRGILHLDIRPANVIVNRDGPVTQATLIDLGFSQAAQFESLMLDEPLAAASYMSPEQAGLLDQGVDQTADLYSAGVVLFECLAGRSLFQATTMGEVLRQHMTSPTPELRTLGLDVPRSLDEVIQRLLLKDPRDRYQSAEAVGADLAVIAEGLQRGESDPSVVVGLHDRRRTLTEPAFVGRSAELETLHEQLGRSQAGQNGLVFLEAESGGGKSRLLLEFMLRCAQQGLWVLRGQGLDQAAQRPFQLLTGIAAGFVADARATPGLADKVRNALGDHLDAVCASLPELAETLGTTPGDVGPETFAETRSVQALSGLLDALGEAGRPVVLLLDDCQWADQLTLKALSHWQRSTPVAEVARLRSNTTQDPNSGEFGYMAKPGVLLVAAFRSEEVLAGHELRGLQPTAHLTLPDFQTSDVRQLVESMAGPLPGDAINLIERLAAGNPFMASASLRGLVESGALLAADEGWQVDPLAMSDVQSSHHAAAFLARRIELLPELSIRLLTVGAVLGKEFDVLRAATLADQSSMDAIAALDEARRRHIVWGRMHDEHCVFMHDKLRETLLDRLPDDERRDLHLRVALDLEDQQPPPVFELAYHFDSAGESKRALPYALAAAEQSRMQHSLEVAEQQYRIAERGARNADTATRFRIAEGLGDVVMLRGRYEEATPHLRAARELAEQDLAQAQIEGKLGELAFKQGDMEKAIECLERALGVLGYTVPQSSWTLYPRLAWQGIVQVFHSLLPSVFLGRKKKERHEKALLACALFNRLSYAYWFKRGQHLCLWVHLRAMNLGETFTPSVPLAHAYAIHAPVMTLVAMYDRGIGYAQKSFEMYESLGDVWGQGQALSFQGIALYGASRYEQCIDRCREGNRLLRRTGDMWEVNVTRVHSAFSLFRRGHLRECAELAFEIHESGVELGDAQASGYSLDVWAQCIGPQASAEVLRIERERPREDTQVTSQVIMAEGVRLFWLGEFAEAAELFQQAHQVAEEAGIRNAYTLPYRSWIASALRRQAEETSCWEPHRRNALLRRADKIANKALRVARSHQNDLPHALRESGLVHLMQGHVDRGRCCLDESLEVADRQGNSFEHAQTLLARGLAGQTLDWSGADEDVTSARKALIELGADFALDKPVASSDVAESETVTLSLADRFDTVLQCGRQIAAALSPESIFAAVQEAALQLLRGEQCVVLGVPDNGALHGAITGDFCPAMVQQAMESNCAVAYAEGITKDASESLLLSGDRSVLCAPIVVRGRPEACFYVTHRRVTGLFGEDEQRLAEFIATIAGAALENAEGFAQLKQLTATLEERVQERTAALEASNIELQQFAYVASHDLQTPLRGMAGFAHFLKAEYQDQLDETADEYIEQIIESAKRMQQLINDLLVFSRVESPSRPFTAIDLNEVYDDVLTLLRASIDEMRGKVTRSDLPTVVGDGAQLTQLLQNLIGNGMKYSGEQTPEVHVSAEQIDGHWTIAVKDNGIGIEEEYHEKIFEIFRRLHTQEEYAGTGIGLAVCRRIVHRHGGEIWVQSQQGAGTTFYFTISDRQISTQPSDQPE